MSSTVVSSFLIFGYNGAGEHGINVSLETQWALTGDIFWHEDVYMMSEFSLQCMQMANTTMYRLQSHLPSPISINACQWQQAGWNWRKWKMFIWFPTLLSSSIYHPHTSLSCYRDIPMHDTTTTFNSKKTFCAEKHIKKRCKFPSWLFIFVIIIKHIYTDLPAKKSKVTFKSLGLRRGDLSGVQSVLTSFYSK